MTDEWQPPAPAQVVANTTVSGHLYQFSQVDGPVTINADRQPYRMDAFDDDVTPITVSQARAQPGRLLLARHRVVPFTGRSDELADIAAWLDEDAAVSVRLIHAAGGHGKTRLADHVGSGCAAVGWTVWRVTQGANSIDGTAQPITGGSVLAVVDYADRWPMSNLLALVADLRATSDRTSAVVRVLMLARSSRSWWRGLAYRLDNEYAVPTSARALAEVGDRLELFPAAYRSFRTALGVSEGDELAAPDALSEEHFSSVLSVHMAALVAVDARRRGAIAPTGPHALSRYLLTREEVHWRQLQECSPAVHKTSPKMMGRAVHLATLIGPMPRTLAQAALERVSVTEPGSNTILDEHQSCYPPRDSRTVLQPLYPDRLGEDFLALRTPGHPWTDDETGWDTDDWAVRAAHQLLAGASGEDGVPEWAPAALTALVETARRWDHIAVEVLNPLLRQRPDLAFAAGGTTLSRLAELPPIEPDVLVGIELLLPRHRYVGLEVAAAAITTALCRQLSRHLAVSTPDAPGLPTDVHGVAAIRLYDAGHLTAALEHAEKSVTGYREAAEGLPCADLAASLNILASSLELDGQNDAARRAVREAVEISRSLPAEDPRRVSVLAMSLLNHGWIGRYDSGAPVAACTEAVELLRALAGNDPDQYREMLGLAVSRLGSVLGMAGQHELGLDLCEEAVRIMRELAVESPETHLPDLAMALNNVSVAQGLLRRGGVALASAENATEIYRRLVALNPKGYRPALATTLVNSGRHLCQTGRHAEALIPLEEALDILRPLTLGNASAYCELRVTALDTLTIAQWVLGHSEQAVASAEEAVAEHRAALSDRLDRERGLALALVQLSVRYGTAKRPGDALPPVQEALAIARRLAEHGQDSATAVLGLSLGVLGTTLASLERFAEAVPVAREAVDVWRGLVATSDGSESHQLAQALWMLGLSCVKAKVDLPDALAALQEAIGILDRSLGDEPDGTTFPNTSIGLAVHWYARVLDALGRNEEADLVRLRMHWEGGVRRRADALRTTPITLDQLARTMECPVDAARAEMARMVEFGYAVLTRPGPDGPVPVRPDTIADHARFSYEYTWPWQLDQDGPSGN